MEEKATDLLNHLKLTIGTQKIEIARVKQYLTVLLTCAQANLFSEAFIATLLKEIQQILLNLQKPPFSLNSNAFRGELNQALRLAKRYQQFDLEKAFRRLQPTSSTLEEHSTLIESQSGENAVYRQTSTKNLTQHITLWHHPYIKPLFQLYEYLLSDKKPPFEALLEKILPILNSALENPSLKTEHPIALDFLQLLQKNVFSKEEAQSLLVLTKNLSQICLSAKESDNAYALLEKAIILADQFNLATHKVNLALLQAAIFNISQDENESQSTGFSPEKTLESLKIYFDALRTAENSENETQLNEVSYQITCLEKNFLYQTIKPWIGHCIGQVVESGSKEKINNAFERFKSLAISLMTSGASKLALECLVALQSGLTPSMSDLHKELLNAFHLFSTDLISPSKVVRKPSVLSGEWQRYRRQISSYRKILKRGITKPLQFTESQQAFTENMRGLAAQFLRESETLLGDPPEAYCLFGLGSISRGMSPFSDLECVLLVSNPQSADWESKSTTEACYFDALYQLFEFKMASLGELCGFHLDTEGHPRKEFRLRGTIKKIIEQSIPPKARLDSEMTYSLLQPCFIYGNKTLWEQYQTEWNIALVQPVSAKESKPWGALIATHFIQRHSKYLKEQFGLFPNLNAPKIDIKTRYVSPLFYLIRDIALYHELFFSSPMTALDQLVSQHNLSNIWANAYRQAIQCADRIRVRLHLHYGEQQDLALLDSANTNDAQFIALTSEEKAYLKLIDMAILKPIQHAFARLEAGYPNVILNPTQDLFDLNLSKLPDSQTEFSDSQREAMQCSIATLILSDANAEAYRLFYLSLKNNGVRSLFFNELNAFKIYYSKETWQLIQAKLNDAPYSDGTRDKQKKELTEWESQLSHLVAAKSNTHSLQVSWIQSNGEKKEGLLHPKIIEILTSKKLLDSKGKLKLLEKYIDLPGRHLVVRLSLQIDEHPVNIYIKFFPEMPGMEYAAGRLAHLLVGWGTPYVQLARLTDGEKIYPILLSQTIEGPLLSDLLKVEDANQLHKRLDPKHYSQRVVLSLLLGEEDGKPSNYVATSVAPSDTSSNSSGNTPSYEIVCIDNDHCFSKALIEENGELVIGIKDIVFCFETMEDPLDSEVQMDILALNAYSLLKVWLDDLDKFNRHLAKLFSDEDIKKAFPKNQATQRFQQTVRQKFGEKEAIKESVLPIVLPEHVAADIYVKLTRIQSYLQHHARPTHSQLLRHIEPYLSWYYGNLLSQYPNIQERFHYGFSKLYSEKKDKSGTQQTLKTGFATLQTLHGKPIDVKEFLERKQFSIEDARKELAATIDRERASKTVYEQLQGSKEQGLIGLETLPDNYLRTKIINRLEFKLIDENFEKLLWETVIKLKIPFQKLSLKNSAINLTQFKAILSMSPELGILQLENCQNLNDELIKIVAEYSPILEKLTLCKLPLKILNNRESLIRQLLTPLNAKPVTVFKKLIYFAIQDCNLLTDLYLEAPSITHLQLIHCTQITKGTINSENLKSIKIIDCPAIKQQQLSKLLPHTKELKNFQIEKCPQLTHLDFYQSFPYLLSLDISPFTTSWRIEFTKILKPYTPEKINASKTFSIFNKLNNYFLQIHKLKDVLIEQLKQESTDVKITAILMLGKLGCVDDKVIDTLKFFLKNADTSIQQASTTALSMLEQTHENFYDKLPPEWRKKLEASDSKKAQLVFNSSKLAPELIKKAKDKNWQERKSAILQIRDSKIDSKEVRLLLREALKDTSDQIRELTIETLGTFETPDKLIISAFLEGLKDKSWRVREAAIAALGHHYSEVNESILLDIETAIVDNSDINIRKTFATTLGSLRQSIPVAFEKLLLLIKSDPFNDVKQTAIESSIKWISHAKLQQHLESIDTLPQNKNLQTQTSSKKEAFSWAYVALAICLARANDNKFSGFATTKSTDRLPFHDLIIHIFTQLNLPQKPSPFSGNFVGQYFFISRRNINKVSLPKQVSNNKDTSSSNQNLSNTQNIGLIPSSIFPENFNYLKILREHRNLLSTFINGKSTLSENALASQLVSKATTPLTKMILLEAIEFMPVILADQQKNIEKLANNIALAENLSDTNRKSKTDLLPLLAKIDFFLQKQLENCRNDGIRQQIQQAKAAVLILRDAYLEQQKQGKNWNKKLFLKNIPLQKITDTKLESKNITLKKLWFIIDMFFQTNFSLSQLRDEEKSFSNAYRDSMKRYKLLLNAFKTNLNLSSKNPWKQEFLYNSSQPIQRCGGKRGVSITSFFHLNESFQTERCIFYKTLGDEITALLGNTYFGAEKPKVLETTLCMDANYQRGHTGATSDGYGHFSDAEQNRNVQKTAYRTVKLAVRYADLYLHPQTLYNDLPILFNHLKQTIPQSFSHPEEAGTASCVLTKVFTTSSNPDFFVVVAAGVGDGMAIAWDPSNCVLSVLINPRQYDRGSQFTPTSITEKLEGEMLQCTLATLPKGSLILRLTDGAWQSLPYSTQKVLDKKTNKHYLEYTLDQSIFLPQITSFAKQNSMANAEDYHRYLFGLIQKSIADKKLFLIKETETIRKKLLQFPAKKSGSMQDFLNWIEQNDKAYHLTILKFLDEINVSAEQVKNAPLTDFEKQLDKINLGDDIVLHVERVGNTSTSPTSSLELVKT